MNNIKNAVGLVCLTVILMFTNNSYSQFKNFGIKGGLNISGAKLVIPSLNVRQPKDKIGFNVGLFYDFLNFNNLIVSGEAGFSSRGYKDIVTDEFGNDFFYNTNSLNYIDISVIGKLIVRSKQINPYLSIGPVLAFYTGYSISAGRENVTLPEKNDLLENLDKITYGIKIGIGIEINKIIPQTLIAEARYYTDLKESVDNGFLTFKTNKMWEFNLGVKF